MGFPFVLAKLRKGCLHSANIKLKIVNGKTDAKKKLLCYVCKSMLVFFHLPSFLKALLYMKIAVSPSYQGISTKFQGEKF